MNLAVDFESSQIEPTYLSLADVESARQAQRLWAAVSVRDRLRWVRRLRELIAEQAGALAEASASSRGRPVIEALTAEVLPLADACRFLERNGEKLLAPRPLAGKGRPLWLWFVRSEIRREPLGLVLVIGPSNYPLLLPGVQLLQALLAGNAVLLKPGTGGTAAGQALVELAERAGLDRRLIVVLGESVQTVHAALALRPDKVLLTGSAQTGERVLSQLAPHLIPATMELSGSDSVIVRADADLGLVTEALAFGLRFNGGATCVAPKRVIVNAAVATELEGRLAEALRHDRIDGQEGAPHAPQGPCDTGDLTGMIRDALRAGAHLIAGALEADGEARWPIVLGGVAPDARLMHSSVFAPVLTVVTVSDDEEAVRRANASPYALGASIFTADLIAGRKLAGRVNAGLVTINDLIVPSADPRVPFGGRGRSGFGVTRGSEGLLELTTPKVVTVTRGTIRPAFKPAHLLDRSLFENYALLVHGRDLSRRLKSLIAIASNVMRRRSRI